MKTRKVVLKRYKLTKSGKLIHRTQGRRHLRRKKSHNRKRRQDRVRTIKNKKFARNIKRLLVYNT